MSARDIYWVEHREDPHGLWERVEALPVGWTTAVEQLGRAAEAALDRTDPDEADDIATECHEFIRAIGKGFLREVPTPASTYTGRYLRIASSGPRLADTLVAHLRWTVIQDAHGRAAITITTHAGHTLRGTLAWDDIDAHGLSIRTDGRTTVLRPERVESFALATSHHSGRRSPAADEAPGSR